ncbi:hypothetical protein WJX81_003603 [Elliptochloris bilobata]|uniref:rRNA methylase n=1 Tax=Elliptochloris bilobata TaxID=381761 RepID=A0AAW1SL14_9CHLO
MRLSSLLFSGGKLTAIAQSYWADVVRPGGCVVDATVGNGHDTLFLARLVGPSGHVYGFDVQEDALQATRATLDAGLQPLQRPRTLSLVKACHSTMLEHVLQPVQLVCFNLGYLPGHRTDRALTTKAESTVGAVLAALSALEVGGIVSVLAYVGHPGGPEEYEAVRQVAEELEPEQWTITEQRLLNRTKSPILIIFMRRLAKDA